MLSTGFQRVTFSFPRSTVSKLEKNVPKNKRSKFVAELIEKNFSAKEEVTLESIREFWSNLTKNCPRKTNKTALEMQREDRLSH